MASCHSSRRVVLRCCLPAGSGRPGWRWDYAVETALFRVLAGGDHQCGEALRRQSGQRGPGGNHDGVWLTVEDDGRGFDLGSGANGQELGVRHLGLLGVRERLALFGGSLEVESVRRAARPFSSAYPSRNAHDAGTGARSDG